MRNWMIGICIIGFPWHSMVGQDAPPLTHIDASTPATIQIMVAKQAAPPEVSDAATVYVLAKSGYVIAQRGTNGFSCLIDRERLDTMEPECFDAEGSSTTLLTRLRTESLRARGISEDAIARDIKTGYETGRFRAPRKAGIVYMLSDLNRVYDPDSQTTISFPGHLMFYAPYAKVSDVGSGRGAPYLVHPGQPDALMIVVPRKAGPQPVDHASMHGGKGKE